MASPVPKPASMRQRRNRSTSATTLTAGPAARVELPKDYDPRTLKWWATIWDSPIADEWVDADVPGLQAVAQLVDDFWTADANGRAKRHAELRMAAREYGLSPFSRRQLQWEVKRVEGAKPASTRVPRLRGGRAVLSALEGGKTA